MFELKLSVILAQNLRTVMSNHPILNTMEKVAARSGVSYGTVDRILKSEVSTSIDNVQGLANAFHISIGALLSKDGVLQNTPLYDETVEAIEVLQSLDKRGRQRAMLALNDSVDLHKAHMKKIS